MAQLTLFEGSHLPRTAAREALSRGELGEARAQLERAPKATEEAADAARLQRIASALRAASDDPAASVHDAFADALARAESPGFLSDADWFRIYAQRMADALDPEPGRRFRGWLGAHFALAAGEVDAARRAAARLVEALPPGPAWIEAARLAFELGDTAEARGWIHAACLDSPIELDPKPPALERCGVAALDAAPSLPALPAPVEDLFAAARALEGLPGPRTRWVAVVGEIDRVLAPRSPSGGGPSGEGPSGEGPSEGTVHEGDAHEGAGHAAAHGAAQHEGAAHEGTPHDDDPVRAFLAALRAARRSRERDRARGPERCSDRELRARRRMQRLSPALLDRYLRGLGGSLF